MIILAILATIIIGWAGAVFGLDFVNGFSELGIILAIVTMGTFIMIEIRRTNKK